jgi:hypothetical protein
MRDNPGPATFLNDDSLRRSLRGLVVGTSLFVVLGTVTAVWANPLFVRMTPVGPWEFGATLLTALLGGTTAALWVPQCTLRASGTGGLASFLGIACPTCNKILVLIFGGPALLAWFDPLRPWLAAAGLVIMGISALATWRRFRAVRIGNREVKGLRGLDRGDVK